MAATAREATGRSSTFFDATIDHFLDDDRYINVGRLRGQTVQSFGRFGYDSASNEVRIEASKDGAATAPALTIRVGDPVFEAARFLSTGEFQIGPATSSSGFVTVRRDQNAFTRLRLENATDGTLAAALVSLTAGTGGAAVNGGIGVFPLNFTPGVIEADSLDIGVSGAANGIVIRTFGAAPVKIKTNSIERLIATSTGEIQIGPVSSTVELVTARRDQNGDTRYSVENATSAANAFAAYSLISGTGGTLIQASVAAFSLGFTPINGLEDDSLSLSVTGAANGLILLTQDATPIKFKTNQIERGLISANGDWTLTQGIRTTGSPTFLTFTAAAHTTLAAGTEATDVNFNLARTVQFATGAIALGRAFRIQGPTYAFVAASTITDAVTLDVDPPVAGTNATFTNTFAARFNGNVRIGGKLTVTGAIDPTEVLLSGGAKKIGATDAGTIFVAPFADSTAAFQVRESDDTEVVLNVDTLNGRVGIENATGVGPQYRLDIGNLSYFAINSSFGHIIQHNSAAATFWSIAPRNGGDLDIAVTTSDPRPTSGTIGTGDNALSIKADKEVQFLGKVSPVMGASGSFSVAGGVANSQFTDVGNVGLGEDTLQTFTLLANALNANGKAIRIRATFRVAANTNIKTVKLHFGATVIASSGPSDLLNNLTISFDVIVVRTGASAQRSTAFRVEGTGVLLIRTTPAQDTTAAIVIKGTGETDTNVNDDVVQESMLTEFLN